MEIDVLLRGIGIGFAIAAPVGPIGLLCIRRTLADGRGAGIATGMGAATADAVYGLLVAVGFAATGVLLRYATPMAFCGGLLIIWLGIGTLRSFFAAGTTRDSQLAVSSHKTILRSWATTFVLTLSNPMTILAFVGLVAGLGATTQGTQTGPYWLVLGVFLGSALWWLILVQLALTARTRLTPDVTRWFDLFSGCLLLGWGAWIAVTAVV
ncbi:leucine export protein LeuE [Shimia thalassica]|uniref:Leucine export protein LeuE n=1 Tax=Shimia thalassica TaxID=1715693 RepID=A0A0P1ILN1_9RHOB|nr:LysE family transporter [Shimia thalassica]CUK10339.1 leucine export protein LeuE [Shimia thalassica]